MRLGRYKDIDPIVHNYMLRNLPNKFELGRSPEDNFMPQIARKIGNLEIFSSFS